jgi:AraC family transcriptional regulator
MPSRILNVPKAGATPGALTGKERGRGLLTANGALYIGPTQSSTIHLSHAHKVYIRLSGVLSLQLADGTYLNPPDSVVIAPDIPHCAVDNGAVIAIYYLLPETDEGRLVSRFGGGRDIFAPRTDVTAALTRRLKSFFENGCSPAEVAESFSYLFANLTPVERGVDVFDRRIKFVIDYLDATLDRRVTVSELASLVSLSPSRVEHLFSEQVGIPINRYLLWRRLHYALKMFLSSSSLTEVAHNAGFADSSHLSRTFRRLLGIPPSIITRDIDLFQAGETLPARALTAAGSDSGYPLTHADRPRPLAWHRPAGRVS